MLTFYFIVSIVAKIIEKVLEFISTKSYVWDWYSILFNLKGTCNFGV